MNSNPDRANRVAEVMEMFEPAGKAPKLAYANQSRDFLRSHASA